jgi:hypothetical protein
MIREKIVPLIALSGLALIFCFSAFAFFQGLITGSVWTDGRAKDRWWRNVKVRRSDNPFWYWFYIAIWGLGTALGTIMVIVLGDLPPK